MTFLNSALMAYSELVRHKNHLRKSSQWICHT